MTNSFSPLVQDKTKAQNESIKTIVGKLDDKEVYIPDYQRDSEQWDYRKQSHHTSFLFFVKEKT